jgi:hypothetical protein
MLLVVHETRWNVMPVKCYAELSPWDLVVVLKSGGVSSPRSSYKASRLLGGIHNLFVLYEVKQTKLILGGAERVIHLQQISWLRE